ARPGLGLVRGGGGGGRGGGQGRVRGHRAQRPDGMVLPRPRVLAARDHARGVAMAHGLARAGRPRAALDRAPAAGSAAVSLAALLGPLFPGLSRPLRADDSPATLPEWDSFKQVEIVLAGEETFAIDLTTREIPDRQSRSTLLALLRARGLAVEP